MTIQRAAGLRWISGLKYRTTEPYWVFTNFRPKKAIQLNRIHLTREGLLFIESGYSSDGPSGPTIDTKYIMPGTTGAHDPGYELLRNEMLNILVDIVHPSYRPGEGVVYITNDDEKIIINASHDQIRKEWDKLLADLMLLDGQIACQKLERYPVLKRIAEKLIVFRARYFYDGIRLKGLSASVVCREEYTAP